MALFRYAAPRPLPADAPAGIDRLLTWLEPFEAAFGHVAQRFSALFAGAAE
jgi:hypothetical protein